ncbi:MULTISPECIES: hypothetical protein [Micromonospora]|uniref:Uncharacterized protein n=1 Tax=Micromonospora yangpuensis TaxID=683228 RepID=A0A1C6VBR8_9ACTN|nr:hypothetical protein [Micromonospora yangpuensis]GGM12439.1 hypothetical protein GCM10012279_33160 [Micromonospora yangpuensis]SCL63705.1 hypothetical protein GA0070617_5276 [Micromonospora yangpuensis]
MAHSDSDADSVVTVLRIPEQTVESPARSAAPLDLGPAGPEIHRQLGELTLQLDRLVGYAKELDHRVIDAYFLGRDESPFTRRGSVGDIGERGERRFGQLPERLAEHWQDSNPRALAGEVEAAKKRNEALLDRLDRAIKESGGRPGTEVRHPDLRMVRKNQLDIRKRLGQLAGAVEYSAHALDGVNAGAVGNLYVQQSLESSVRAISGQIRELEPARREVGTGQDRRDLDAGYESDTSIASGSTDDRGYRVTGDLLPLPRVLRRLMPTADRLGPEGETIRALQQEILGGARRLARSIQPHVDRVGKIERYLQTIDELRGTSSAAMWALAAAKPGVRREEPAPTSAATKEKIAGVQQAVGRELARVSFAKFVPETEKLKAVNDRLLEVIDQKLKNPGEPQRGDLQTVHHAQQVVGEVLRRNIAALDGAEKGLAFLSGRASEGPGTRTAAWDMADATVHSLRVAANFEQRSLVRPAPVNPSTSAVGRDRAAGPDENRPAVSDLAAARLSYVGPAAGSPQQSLASAGAVPHRTRSEPNMRSAPAR